MAPVDTELEQPGGPHTRPNQPSEGVRSPGTPPSGPGIGVGGGGPPHAPASDLPPGVHPMDPSGAEVSPVPGEAGSQRSTKGRKPFSTDNGEAFPTFERSAHDWRGGVVAVNLNNSGTAQVVGRLPGRKKITLWVPDQLVVGGALVTPAAGVLFATTEGEMQSYGGTILNVGDAATIEAEAAVFIGLIPGAVVGYVQFMEFYNPPGGGITGNT